MYWLQYYIPCLSWDLFSDRALTLILMTAFIYGIFKKGK